MLPRVLAPGDGDVTSAGDDVTDDDTAVFSLLDKQKEIQDAENTNFTWFKDGEEFDPAERFKVLFKVSAVTLPIPGSKCSAGLFYGHI